MENLKNSLDKLSLFVQLLKDDMKKMKLSSEKNYFKMKNNKIADLIKNAMKEYDSSDKKVEE